MKSEEEKQIQDYLGRPARYANIDGVVEIVAGLSWFGLGTWVWIPSIAPKGSIWQTLWVLLPLFLAWQTLLHFGSQAFKRRVTYPRTGFVACPSGKHKVSAVGLIAITAAVSAAVPVLVYLMMRKGFQPFLVVGGPMTVGYGLVARPLTAWRWAILALMAAGTVGLAFMPGGFHRQVAVGMALYSGLFLVSGLIALVLYLRHSQPSGQVAE
jgi:hypothetical protein